MSFIILHRIRIRKEDIVEWSNSLCHEAKKRSAWRPIRMVVDQKVTKIIRRIIEKSTDGRWKSGESESRRVTVILLLCDWGDAPSPPTLSIGTPRIKTPLSLSSGRNYRTLLPFLLLRSKFSYSILFYCGRNGCTLSPPPPPTSGTQDQNPLIPSVWFPVDENLRHSLEMELYNGIFSGRKLEPSQTQVFFLVFYSHNAIHEKTLVFLFHGFFLKFF
jgi:hypothetical protein